MGAQQSSTQPEAKVEVEVTTGLTPLQKELLLSTWEFIAKDIHNHSVLLFFKFFTDFPQYKKYFQAISRNPMHQVMEDVQIQLKFRTILLMIGSLVKSAAFKQKTLTSKINFLAMVHKNLELSEADFFNFRDTFIEHLKIQCPDEMTNAAEATWHHFLTKVLREVCARIDEIKAKDRESEFVTESNRRGTRRFTQMMASLIGQKQEKDEDYWKRRGTFWEIQKELWGANESDTEEKELEETPSKTKQEPSLSHLLKGQRSGKLRAASAVDPSQSHLLIIPSEKKKKNFNKCPWCHKINVDKM